MKIELNETNIKIIVNLHWFFNDYKNVVKWLKTDNLNFGGIPPVILIENSRGSKLLKFIETALEENGKI